ncbi:cobalamin B12-binding domain-containing protein [Tateyamaria omphalii]|uniref:cobalamin B12-binding domain-containing protein n=1 Tax=Tateyamaria omphalii TaxID=299262 RepID=UPI001C993DEA|nr:cobalamin B12-binding domain-containing protein [Tateyamaria omphalii]MBY5935459.1 cobalamin B12-binding domain-containing protein [Tateyamaria omphalii]
MTQDDPFGPTRHPIGRACDQAAFASEVISILNDRQVVGASGARQVALDYLVRAVIKRVDFDARLVLDEMRAYRLTNDALIDIYIPRTAEHLGELWMTSDLDFAAVTIGALRLQALLGEAAQSLSRNHADMTNVLNALVIVPESEQHFLGASVVAAQLRRLGCDVSVSINESQQQVVDRVGYDRPDMVLFSCARAVGLETIRGTVKKIRHNGDPTPVLALGGAFSGFTDGIKKQTGVDLVTNTAKDVVGFTTKRQKALGPR